VTGQQIKRACTPAGHVAPERGSEELVQMMPCPACRVQMLAALARRAKRCRDTLARTPAKPRYCMVQSDDARKRKPDPFPTARARRSYLAAQ
jgi:hypothetical protein